MGKIAHIYLYGLTDSIQSDEAQQFGVVNLLNVKDQLEKQSGAEEIHLHIRSEGGDVSEGYAIYDFMRSQGMPITTIIEGNCFSMATIIALAGEKRIMLPNAKFLIHNPRAVEVQGGSKDLKEYASLLEREENKAAEIYAANSNLSKEEALKLMAEETMFTAEQALEKGFVSEVKTEMKAVAFYRPKTDPAQESVYNSLKSLLVKFFGEPKQKLLVVQDANGTEIDFIDLEERQTPKVGDRATIESKSAEGEYVMPSGEIYVFEAGKLVEIKEKVVVEEEAKELQEKINSLEAENKNLKSENKEAKEGFQMAMIQIEDLKSKITSRFNYTPEIVNKKEPITNTSGRVRTPIN